MPRLHHLKLPSSSSKKQAENKSRWNYSRKLNEADFFTIGYIGRTLDAIIEALLSAGVRSLLDIRENPVSMYRPELNRISLERSLTERGLFYVHLPHLGVPRDIRAKAIEDGNRAAIWDWYDQHVVEPYFLKNLHWFLNGIEHPAALMCVEIDPTECHRHRVVLALESMGLHGYDL
jgi:uncharacterized protein (DUF488 family)